MFNFLQKLRLEKVASYHNKFNIDFHAYLKVILLFSASFFFMRILLKKGVANI